MQFSDTTNDTGLYQDAQFLTATDSNSFPINDFTRFANRHYYNAVIAIWESSGDWEWDDTNQSDFPIATTTLVNSQPDYSIPTNALKVLRVEVQDSANNWTRLRAIDDTQIQIALDEFQQTDGIPKYYRMVRNSVVLYPAPDTTQVTASAGLKLYLLREPDEFTAADTTQEPGFAEPFHRVISLGAAYDFAVAKNKENMQMLKLELEQLMQAMRTYYSKRNVDFEPRLRRKIELYV